jgi:hypothetical protein
VAAESAVERKEVRQVRPVLIELQVPKWQELILDRQKWGNMLKGAKTVLGLGGGVQAQGVGSFAQRYRVGQPTEDQTKGQGISGNGVPFFRGPSRPMAVGRCRPLFWRAEIFVVKASSGQDLPIYAQSLH